MNATEQKAWDALDPLDKLTGLVDLTNQTQTQLAGAIKLLKERDAQIDIAITALLKISMDGNMTAGQALLDMKALHDKSL